ncbi:hypothetical protein [Ralstonia solanacearum]|uniref:hypothetical protein n=1 Tax=Ralstonia solanacearum TaxID=305 RepID=UPI001E5BAD14|nr:hypothetical protein [Ralstonia solanacearum]
MGQQQRIVPGARRFVQDEPRHLGRNAFAQQAVLAHRKPVAWRQRQDEVIGIEGLHEHAGSHCSEKLADGRIVTYAIASVFLRPIQPEDGAESIVAPKRRNDWLQKLRQTVCDAIPGNKKPANFDFCAMHKNGLTLP